VSERSALLVIGGGPAGLGAARAYREADGAGAVAIVTDEHRMPYRRPPLTKELLRGEADEGELPIEAETWLHEHQVRLVSGRTVALDTDARTVALSAARIAQWLRADGVKLRCGEPVDAIERQGETVTVSTGGAGVRAGVVVMAAGVARRGELAAAVGIATDGGAIPVDAAMRTAADGVVAAGDVCRAYNVAAGRELRVEHWGDALGQGAIAGQTAAGREAA
jgi:3-phenylpropionate/trans-cinnamate dioxygenase ferredoxin reductase component